MLRIIERHNAAETEKYFDVALATSDYYVRGCGTWGGKGAERLGLSDEVKREDFLALANNKVPGKDEMLTLRVKEDRRTGYDFCFDVPKSLSLYLALNDDEAVERMIQEAFREAMDEVEQRIEVRVRKGGAQEDRVTGNLVFASFVHRETRPIGGIPDPHYHIHAFVFNATFDETEGVWKAAQFVNAKRNAPFYEAGFNARLAEKLMAAGFGIRRTDRHFELSRISRELIQKFSKRTELIEQIAREKHTILEAEARALAKRSGMEFADAFALVKAELGARTRESKSSAVLSPDEQLANWRSQMTSEERASLSPEAVKAAPSENLLEAEEAKELALDHLFEGLSLVRELQAVAILLRRGIGRISIEEALRFAKSDPRLLRPGNNLVTTREVLAEEIALLEAVQAGRGKHEETGRGGKWSFLSPLVEGNPEHKNAVFEILRSKDLVTSVRGPAGSGKTSMMEEAVKAIAALSGREVLVFAPSSSAVKVLKQEGFAVSETFQQLMQSELLQDVARGRILWIDEAGFLSTRQMRWAVDFARANDCRLILSGDTRQHHSVDRGDALRVLEDSGAIDQAALTRILRQRIPALREAIQDLSQGKTESGLDKLEAAGVIHEVEDNDERLDAIAVQHLGAVRDGVSSLIVAPTHAECRAIARRIREELKAVGLVGRGDTKVWRLARLNLSESQRRDPINYRPGLVIEFHRRARGGFKSGEKWTVVDRHDDAMLVARDGRETPLPLSQAKSFEVYRQEELPLAAGDSVRITKNFRCGPARFTNNEVCRVDSIDACGIRLGDARIIKAGEPLHLDQGIAVTSHASQGKTVDQVIVSVPVSAFSQANEAQFYVSMSRARRAMHLYTDSKAAFKEAVMRSSERLSPSELIQEIKGGCNGILKEMIKPTVKTLEQRVMTR